MTEITINVSSNENESSIIDHEIKCTIIPAQRLSIKNIPSQFNKLHEKMRYKYDETLTYWNNLHLQKLYLQSVKQTLTSSANNLGSVPVSLKTMQVDKYNKRRNYRETKPKIIKSVGQT